MKSRQGFWKGFLTGLFCAAFVLSVGYLGKVIFIDHNTSGNQVESSDDTSDNTSVTSKQTLSKVQYLKALIDKNYLSDIKEDDLVEGLYKGVLSGLDDPYSVYYTAEEYTSLMESTTGVYCGIGVSVSQNVKTGVITVVRPFENCPGYNAGMRAGDLIYKVNDIEVTGMDLNKVVSMIKGEENTTVKITVLREGESDYMDITVTRQQIEIPTINYKMLDNNMGYIQITEFDEVTGNQFEAAYNDLISQGMTSVVFDVRNNPGGRYDIVCQMLDLLLPKGVIVYTEDRDGNQEKQYSDAEHAMTIPSVVLVNGESASAAEIFAGAIKDYQVGTLIGTTTFGKGIVQRIFPLSDGSAVKLTISKYFTPNGNNIHGKGITPDIEVELPDGVYLPKTVEEDTQLQKAIEALTK